jgi:hypothetical protein
MSSLLEQASLIVTPNAFKAGKLYSIKPTDGSGDLDVVRATTATRVNSAGLIESVANNVPRLDYTNGSCPSILVEPQRTNLIINSVLSGGTSGTPGTPPTSWAQLATDGTITYLDSKFISGKKLNINVSAGRRSFSLSFSFASNSTYIFSCDLDVFTTGVQFFQYFTFFSLPVGSTVDWFLNGISVSAGTIIPIGFNKINIIIKTSTTSGSPTFRFGIGTQSIMTGNATFDLPQLEQASTPSSYIPTEATTVTRNADVISKTGISDLIGQSEGTMFIDTKYSASTTASGRWFNVFGTTNNIGLALNGLNSVRTIINGASDTITTAPKTDLGVKLAFAYNSLGVVLFINGVQYALPNGGSSIITSLNSIVFDPLANSQLQTVDINLLAVWKERLSDTELQQLTTL